MSNRTPDVATEHVGRTLRFAFAALMKDVHTILAGEIDSYNPRTRLARVQPAPHIVMTDGAVHPRALLVNVPVIWPAPAGFVIHGPLPRGTPVLVGCSERDMAAFKASRRPYIPEDPRMFSLIDAVAIAGFGPPGEIEPASTEGLTVQTNDGGTSIVMTPGEIVFRARQIRFKADRIDDEAY